MRPPPQIPTGGYFCPLPNRSGRFQGTTPTTWLNFNTPRKSQPTILPYYIVLTICNSPVYLLTRRIIGEMHLQQYSVATVFKCQDALLLIFVNSSGKKTAIDSRHKTFCLNHMTFMCSSHSSSYNFYLILSRVTSYASPTIIVHNIHQLAYKEHE